MKIVTFAGPPSCGKTSVILKVAGFLKEQGFKPGVVKFDCLATGDDELFRKKGIPAVKAIAGVVCPDHFFAVNVGECIGWAAGKGVDMLIIESAGLCNRCSPHIDGIKAVCVVDNLSGIGTPGKVGPMLRSADIVVITKWDIVSQAEREVFSFKVKIVNPDAHIVHVNGITGQGAYELSTLLVDTEDVKGIESKKLRFPMPSAVCSYCLGEVRLGERYQSGNVKKVEFDIE